MKTEVQEAFENSTKDWGLEYDMDENGKYIEFQTGSAFGIYELGWIDARKI